MSTPPTRRIPSRESRRNVPAALNEAPSATKITEKPTTKAMACSITRRRAAAVRSALRSDTDMPVTKDRYEGNSGSTQGDRNENSPAVNATTTPSGSFIGPRASATQPRQGLEDLLVAGADPVVDLDEFPAHDALAIDHERRGMRPAAALGVQEP